MASAGCAIVGQTAALAPADKRLYAIRDATGTVESIPLITASILSKKLAAGLDALVMDVKVGSGAFLPGREAASELARSIVDVARGNGLPTSALLTDMDRVLGRAAGNAVEVRESIDNLTGAARDERLLEVTLSLSAELLRLGGVEPDEDRARAAAEQALASGTAAERFAAMVRELGGPGDLLETPDTHLGAAPVTVAAEPAEAGSVARVDVRAVGLAVVALGGGRTRETDPVDHAVGLTEVAAPGESVEPGGRPLALVHAADREAAGARGRLAARRVHARRARCRAAPDRGGASVSVPKAELHVHLEGTATPDLIRRLAERNGLPVPEGLFASPERFAYTDFLDFLRAYDLAATVIRTGEDYRDVTYEYLARCAAEGAVYVELLVSPDHAALVGLSDEEHLDGIARGIDEARAEHGIEARILITAVRNFGVERAIRVARHAAARPHAYVVGFQMAGDEENFPADALRRALRDRRRGGPRLQRARRRVGGPRERARRAHAADYPHRPRRPVDRGSRARRGAGRARDRARVLPDEQRRAGPLPQLRGAPAAGAAGGGRARDARIGRSAVVRRLDRRRVRDLRGAARVQ